MTGAFEATRAEVLFELADGAAMTTRGLRRRCEVCGELLPMALFPDASRMPRGGGVDAWTRAAVCKSCAPFARPHREAMPAPSPRPVDERPRPRNTRAVEQLDGDGSLVAAYPSMTEAAEAMGVSISSISAACLGRRRTCCGYRWRAAGDGDGADNRV